DATTARVRSFHYAERGAGILFCPPVQHGTLIEGSLVPVQLGAGAARTSPLFLPTVPHQRSVPKNPHGNLSGRKRGVCALSVSSRFMESYMMSRDVKDFCPKRLNAIATKAVGNTKFQRQFAKRGDYDERRHHGVRRAAMISDVKA